MATDSDKSIRAVLAGLPGDDENAPAGQIAIFKHTVEEFGGDNAAVYDWVHAHGGTVKASPGPRRGPGARPELRAYYEMPLEALGERSSD